MQKTINNKITYMLGWGVHLLTASAGVFCLLALYFIHIHLWINAFWALTVCLIIDAIDGTLARKFHVKTNIPQIDGTLLDNLIDFVAYVIVPAFFIITKKLFPEGWNFPCAAMIIIASSYQFTQIDAKTKDNFFKGFPCYWNFTVFYMLVVDGTKLFNLSMMFFLLTLVFIPIKYIYLSRMDYVTKSKAMKNFIYAITALFGVSSLHLIIFYPAKHSFFFVFTFAYIIAYFLFSIYRTIYPLTKTT